MKKILSFFNKNKKEKNSLKTKETPEPLKEELNSVPKKDFEFTKKYELNIGWYSKYTNQYEYEPEDWLKFLLLEDIIFINNGWWLTEKGEWPKDKITLHVNCNDVFAWGCADAEDINFSELEELGRMVMENPKWGSSVWCIKKRNIRPQEPIVLAMKKDGIDVDEILNQI